MSKIFPERVSNLISSINVINANKYSLSIEPSFDLDIIAGSSQYLRLPGVSGLLFIPNDSVYTPRVINKNLMLWTEITSELQIALNVTKVSKNRWTVSIESKSIPDNLLPQSINMDIEISVKFTDNHRVKNGDLILFKIMLNNVTHKINIRKPLEPIEKIDYLVNDYSDVISILQSIQTPIISKTFGMDSFILNSIKYTHPSRDVSKPLVTETID